MTKITLIASLFLCFSAFSQKEIDNQWKNQVNPIFNGLNKSFVPHAVLLDYAMEFTNVPAYNGTLTDSTYINTRVFGNIYKTLFMGKVTTTTQNFPLLETMATDWVAKRHSYNQMDKNTIIMAGLYYKYSKIRVDALSAGKITVSNGKYYDKYNRTIWQNPYETRRTVAFTPPLSVYNKKSFSVILPTNLMYSNYSNEIQSIKVDFNDGNGFNTIVFDQALQPNYSANGTYDWVFKTTLTDNTILLSHSKIKIEQAETNGGSQARMNFENNIFIPGPSGSPFPFYLNGTRLRIDYAPTSNGQIIRPFIVAEGFDAGSILNPEKEGGDRTLNDDFLDDIDDAFPSGLNNLLTGNMQQYDIIYIDWLNGTANIKDNSKVLKKVLEYVNNQKALNGSTQPNVLLGQSMGGVIGRYTLATMEAANEVHDVRLFIAHDAPMQGANTPLSFQYFSRHALDEYVSAPALYGLGEIVVPILIGLTELLTLNNLEIPYSSPEEYLTIQDTPAAVQLNYSWVDPFSNPTTVIHDQWQSELDLVGYPTQSRNVAISNGNECAVNHGFNPGDPFIEVHDDHNPDFWGDLLHLLVTPAIGGAASDYELVILGTLPGSSKYFFDLEIRSNPALNASNREVYWGKVRYEKKLFWLLPISHTITDRPKDAPIGDLPYDTYSGGFFDILDVLTTSDPNDIDLIDRLPSNSLVNAKYGFIPVVSALDIKRNNGDVIPSDYLLKYAGGTIPNPALSTEFINFIVDFLPNSIINNEHISFQARNGNWLANELNEMPVLIEDCSFICGDGQIIGPLVLCSSATYSVSVPAGTTVNWGISNTSAARITSQSGGNVTISATIGYRGDFVLTSNITSVCGNLPLTKTIRVGKPDSPSSISGPSTVNTGAIVNYVAGSSNGATSYEWRLPYPFTIRTPLDYMSQDWQLEGPGNTGNARAVTGYTKKSGYVQVMGKNACGTGGAKLLYVQHATSGGGGGGIPRIDPNDDVVEVTLYPNPTQGKVTVALTNLEDYSGEPPTLIYGIQVLDQNLYERKFYNFNDQLRSQELNVSYLNTGLNYIIVYTDTGTFTKKLIVY